MADSKPPCLTVLGGPMAGNRFVLQDGVANILIGSDPVCAFHLPLPGVSAMHARLAVEPGGVSLWEAGSARGVHVNDSRVEGSAPLRNGDIIWLGTPGEDDVVMLQVILPRLPSLEVPAAPPPESSDDTPAAGTAFSAAVEGETVALDPRALSLEPETPGAAAEPEPMSGLSEPLPIPLGVDAPMHVDSPLIVEGDAASLPPEPEEAGLVVDAEAESFVKMPSDVLVAAPGATAAQDFVLADEGMPLIIQEPASSPEPPTAVSPAALPPVAMPPGFEDETEDRLVVADIVTQVPEPHQVDENAYRAAYDVTLPPTPVVPPAAPPRPAPPPAPALRPPTPSPTVTRPMTTPAPRAARPPSTTPPRKPGPSVSQRTEPAERASAPAAPPAKPSSSTGLYVGLGIGALVLLGGGAFVVMKMLSGKAPAVVQTTPHPVAPPTTAPPPTPATFETPAATPLPTAEAPTPAPVVPTPTPGPSARPTPTPTPGKPGATPTPSPVKPGATPTPATLATPTGPSPEQVRAQQVAGLLTQAEGAMGARQFDQAIGFYDEALKLEPGNAKASAERQSAVASRDAGRRRFVAGRTIVTTEKAAGGGISGFEGAAVQKAPDFQGRIEFDMSPNSGLKAGDPWTLKIFVVNEGKKPIRITDLTATAVVNGERSGGAAGARAKEIAPQARVQVGEMSGAWKDGTQTWSAEVVLTAKGDSLKNTLTWK
jgi:hypothetical protein